MTQCTPVGLVRALDSRDLRSGPSFVVEIQVPPAECQSARCSRGEGTRMGVTTIGATTLRSAVREECRVRASAVIASQAARRAPPER
jgi:hypothetical protein